MHFGNLTNAFSRVGYTNEAIVKYQENLTLRQAICADISINIAKLGGFVKVTSKNQCHLLINEEIAVTIVLGRTSPVNMPRNHNNWRFCYRSERGVDVLIVARIDAGSTNVRDYFVLPFLFLPPGTFVTLSGKNYRRIESFRAASLAPFYALCARSQIRAPLA